MRILVDAIKKDFSEMFPMGRLLVCVRSERSETPPTPTPDASRPCPYRFLKLRLLIDEDTDPTGVDHMIATGATKQAVASGGSGSGAVKLPTSNDGAVVARRCRRGDGNEATARADTHADVLAGAPLAHYAMSCYADCAAGKAPAPLSTTRVIGTQRASGLD